MSIKPARMNIAIFDIDGCISNDIWRRNFIDYRSDPVNFKRYHANAGADHPFDRNIDLLRMWALAHKITFITARPLSEHKETLAWLEKHTGLRQIHDFWLYMRPDGDMSASPELKKKIALELRAGVEAAGGEVSVAFDDRQDVVDMYNSIGIKSFLMNVNGVFDQQPTQTKMPGAIVGQEAERILNSASIHYTDKPLEELLEEDGKVGRPVENVAEYLRSAVSPADILDSAAKTFRERNAVYKDNFKKVGAVMAALFPDGVQLHTEEDHNTYHLFELLIVKLTRFVNSGLRHEDSIHDIAVYAAMIETLVDTHNISVNGTSAPTAND